MAKATVKKPVPSTQTITVEATLSVDLSKHKGRLKEIINELSEMRGEIDESMSCLEEALERCRAIEDDAE